MNILAILKDRLRFIERFYEGASQQFSETKRRVEAGEPPFVPRSFDPERDADFEPPFLAEWKEAYEAANLVGQAALTLVQTALRQCLTDFVRLRGDLDDLRKVKGKDWFDKFRKLFLQRYQLDFTCSPISPEEIEEINLARNDVQHPEERFEFGMTRRRSQGHQMRFPDGIYADDTQKAVARVIPDMMPAINVSREGLKDAVRRVEHFCEFLDAKRDRSSQQN